MFVLRVPYVTQKKLTVLWPALLTPSGKQHNYSLKLNLLWGIFLDWFVSILLINLFIKSPSPRVPTSQASSSSNVYRHRHFQAPNPPGPHVPSGPHVPTSPSPLGPISLTSPAAPWVPSLVGVGHVSRETLVPVPGRGGGALI